MSWNILFAGLDQVLAELKDLNYQAGAFGLRKKTAQDTR